MAPKGVGSLRRSQVVTSFGPGAMIDLPDISVIIGGLEWWRGYDRERIIEPRLEEKVAHALGVQRIALYAPPAEVQDHGGPLLGIQVEQFPLYFIADHEVRRGSTRGRPLAHRNSLVGGKFELDRKKYPVTAVRFVQACPNGHIEDIDWYVFAHSGKTTCRRQLWLDEYGTSGDLADSLVRCECGNGTRALAQATKRDVLGACRGKRPWLPDGEKCGGPGGTPEMMRLLIRTASNAYFPQRLSVLSLPEAGDRIRSAVRANWQVLKDADSVEKLRQFRLLLSSVRGALDGVDDETAFEYIRAEREGHTPPRRDIKVDEFEALTQAAESIGEDRPDGVFYARRLALPDPQPGFMDAVERVVLVHRLREVSAQLGFTRFESVVPDVQGELDLDVKRAALAMEPNWVPAVETRGEGIFLAFDLAALNAWRARPEVRSREDAFRRAQDNGPGEALCDARYVLLHSLAHLLITAVALDCGYNTSSIRERIYVTPRGCGILLYTGTSDADGTLGGLVQAGSRIVRYMEMALELGQLCSNDPVCAQRLPDSPHDDHGAIGAACHGCLLVSETCCERRNEYLDRSLVVGTVQGLGCEFFTATA